MFFRERARVWCGIRRYSSSRITDGTFKQRLAEWICEGATSSADATPFKIKIKARRAAQMLIGS
jgi:hypothetical protein